MENLDYTVEPKSGAITDVVIDYEVKNKSGTVVFTGTKNECDAEVRRLTYAVKTFDKPRDHRD